MEKRIKELKTEINKLKNKNKALSQQLNEARKSIDAIKKGEVDALVLSNEKNLIVLTEKTADKIYRILIEKMHEGAVTLNEEGIIIYCNSCFSAMVNLPLEKVIGTNFKNFGHNDSKENLELILKKSVEKPIKEEFDIQSTGGKIIPVLISLSALDFDDTFIFSLIITDLTVLKKNQEKLLTQKKVLEEAEKIAEIGSWIVDLNTNKVILSDESYRIYGFDPEKDSENISPFELIHQRDQALSKLIFDTAVNKTGDFDTHTNINTPPDYREKILHIKGKVISNNGKNYQLIGTTQNVTALMKAEQELKNNYLQLTEAQEKIIKLNEELESKVIKRTRELESAYDRLQDFNFELEELNNSKDKFIAIISHDLRNPLSSIISTSEIMMKHLETLSEDEIKNFARIINASSKKIGGQLNELVEWSKQKSKKINFNPQAVNLSDFVDFSLELIQFNADQKNISINNYIEKNIAVDADPFLLRSIFQNLITNSIKFTQEGGMVSISAIKKNNFIEISIKDNGIGMPDKIKNKLFRDEAVMNKEAEKGDKTGGLGLILVKDFVEKHKGKIWAESEEGIGTTFYFTLPVAESR